MALSRGRQFTARPKASFMALAPEATARYFSMAMAARITSI